MMTRSNTFWKLSLLLFCIVFLGIGATKLFLSIRRAQLNSALVGEIKTHKDVGTVVSLLSQGADPNARDLAQDTRPFWTQLWDRMRGKPILTGDPPTALQTALLGTKKRPWRDEDLPVIKALLDAGARPDVANAYGDTPLMLATRIRPLEVLDLLLQHGAPVNAQNYKGVAALHEAVDSNNLELVSLMLSRGALVNIRDKYGAIPLHAAAAEGELQVTRLLLANGSEIEVQNTDGYTPIGLAVCSNEIDTVKLLLAHGARLDAGNNRGHTLLYWAQEFHYEAMVRVLKRAGAKQ